MTLGKDSAWERRRNPKQQLQSSQIQHFKHSPKKTPLAVSSSILGCSSTLEREFSEIYECQFGTAFWGSSALFLHKCCQEPAPPIAQSLLLECEQTANSLEAPRAEWYFHKSLPARDFLCQGFGSHHLGNSERILKASTEKGRFFTAVWIIHEENCLNSI